MRVHGMTLVKNEADVIRQSLVAATAWADAIYVYDNGSDDDTWAIVQELAAALTRDFAANLRTRIAASQTPGDGMTEPATATAPAETQPLDAGRLMWRAVGARLRGGDKKKSD